MTVETAIDPGSAAPGARAGRVCNRPAAVTRSLLGYGPLAGACYLASGLAQALTRDGFDLRRHDLSLLANGPLGWIQILTLVLTGLMTITSAVGLFRALPRGRAAAWAASLLSAYGLALVAAGMFVADPMNGFPVGTPDGPPRQVTLHGLLHIAAGGIGFVCLVAAAFVLARLFSRNSRRGWAWASLGAGLVVLAGFLGVATGSASSLAVLGLWIGVVTGWGWIAAVCVHLYRRTPDPRQPRDRAA
ncbi:DUF998 domain-containing protein [Micromonospora sp. MA102]|uniref:DUF998 domain-containing protein n=1 Tax=Micromonospora sp. MA102 TaxID=2952755 RepID=UPI0021C7679C|nr:DUF998 domain-containing protein [Micromonospora sp. MA102]